MANDDPAEQVVAEWWLLPLPEGTALVGAAPPDGDQLWTARADGRKHGPHTTWYESGAPLSHRGWRDGEEHGPGVWWWEGGSVQQEGHWIHGKLHGVFKQWDPDGSLVKEEHYERGVRHGLATTFDEHGEPSSVELYENGEWVRSVREPGDAG